MASTSVNARVQKRRNALRKAGLRPVQIWVPDTRQPGFAEECRRQSQLAAKADRADLGLQHLMDEALSQLGRLGGVRRGDFVTIAIQGDFGKPRPALVIQADAFGEHSTVTVLPVTSTQIDAPLLRVPVHPNPENGLQVLSQVMVDKAVTVNRNKVGTPFGHIDSDTLIEIERRLAVFLGIVK